MTQEFFKNMYVIELIKKLPRGTPFSTIKINVFLNEKGKFSKLNKHTWLFKNKEDAKNYTTDIYMWGSLQDYVKIVPVNVSKQ